jgi:hypothetical protein
MAATTYRQNRALVGPEFGSLDGIPRDLFHRRSRHDSQRAFRLCTTTSNSYPFGATGRTMQKDRIEQKQAEADDVIAHVSFKS